MNKLLITLLLFSAIACNSTKKNGSSKDKEVTKCTQEGTVKDFTGLDGCKFLIVLDNGDKWLPAKINDSNFKLVDGQRIRFGYTELKDMMSICMAESKTVEVTCIEAIESTGKPNIPKCYETKDPTSVKWMEEVMDKYPITLILRYRYTDAFAYFFRTEDKGYLYDCQGFFLCEVEGNQLSQCKRTIHNPNSGLVIWQALGQRN